MCRLAPLTPLLLAFAGAVELVAYATDRQNENLGLLRKTAEWHGWSPLHVIGTQKGFARHGLVDKLRALRRFTRRWPDDTLLVFVDGYDVVVNNEPFALETAFLASGKRVMTAGELGCCVDKETAMAYRTACHGAWPHHGERSWLNSGVIVGYAKDVRLLLRMAWKEYAAHPEMYRAYTDQQLLCYLVSDGSNIWTRASVNIDHDSELALTTYQTDITRFGVDTLGRIVFSNRTVPALIHFNGPAPQKAAQMEHARKHFPLLSPGATGCQGMARTGKQCV